MCDVHRACACDERRAWCLVRGVRASKMCCAPFGSVHSAMHPPIPLPSHAFFMVQSSLRVAPCHDVEKSESDADGRRGRDQRGGECREASPSGGLPRRPLQLPCRSCALCPGVLSLFVDDDDEEEEEEYPS
eukprot:3267624-Rhodomonas_salina.2